MDITLRFAYSNSEEMRTFRVYKRIEAVGGATELELYQASASVDICFLAFILLKFYHSSYGPSSGVTTFQRVNENTSVWEPAGEISWTSSSNATVHFGINEVNIRDLRKAKKSSSQSRRFKAQGSEYKWKMGEGS
ncbi:hypothetical protein B0H17DRAFT_1047627, partial [Mycena rosella]